MNLHPARADEVLQNFVEQDQVRAFGEQGHDLVCARRDAVFVLLAHNLVTLLAAKRPRNPAPHGLRAEFLAGNLLSLCGVEKLAVEHCGVDVCGPWQSLGLRKNVQRFPISGSMEQGGERVGLAAAKRCQQFQYTVSGAIAEAGEHVLQQRAQALGQVGDTEEVLGIAVNGWNVWLAISQRAKVERKDVLGEVLRHL